MDLTFGRGVCRKFWDRLDRGRWREVSVGGRLDLDDVGDRDDEEVIGSDPGRSPGNVNVKDGPYEERI